MGALGVTKIVIPMIMLVCVATGGSVIANEQEMISTVNAAPAPPVTVTDSRHEVTVGINSEITLNQSEPITRCSPAGYGIVDAQIAEGHNIKLRGLFPGTTVLTIEYASGQKAFITISVLSETELAAQRKPPANGIRATMCNGSGNIILTGEATSADQLIKQFVTTSTTVDDRGINIDAANNRLINRRPGE